MKKRLKKIKKHIAKQPLLFAGVCFVAGLILSGTAFAVIYQATSSQTPKSTVAEHKSQAKQSKQAPSPSPSASVSSSPSPSASPSPNNSAATPSTPKKSSSQSNSNYFAACSKKNSDSYVKYNNSLAAENQKHQSILAELQTAYNNGEFYDPGISDEDEYFAYQVAVEVENDRWQDAAKDINIIHLQELAANVCV